MYPEDAHVRRLVFGLLYAAALAVSLAGSAASAQEAAALDFSKLIVDDAAAELTGTWKASTSVAGYVGEGYQVASGPDVHTATFKIAVPAEGEYELLVGYTIGNNRSKNAAV